MKLHTYFRSTAAYRVRIALKLKGLEHELVPVNLVAAEHKSEPFLSKNPEGLVPLLELKDEHLSQSLAILEYLEETHPEPSLLPASPLDRAYVRAMSQTIACDIHPLNNLRVLQYLVNDLKQSEEAKLRWYHHWLELGFNSLEQRLANDARSGLCCFADTPSMADVCLVPQVYNAKRFDFSLDAYPNINRINDFCLSLDAFASARPELQPDAPD